MRQTQSYQKKHALVLLQDSMSESVKPFHLKGHSPFAVRTRVLKSLFKCNVSHCLASALFTCLVSLLSCHALLLYSVCSLHQIKLKPVSLLNQAWLSFSKTALHTVTLCIYQKMCVHTHAEACPSRSTEVSSTASHWSSHSTQAKVSQLLLSNAAFECRQQSLRGEGVAVKA